MVYPEIGNWYQIKNNRAFLCRRRSEYPNVYFFVEKEYYRKFQEHAIGISDIIRVIPTPKFKDDDKIKLHSGEKGKIVNRWWNDGTSCWLYTIKTKQGIVDTSFREDEIHPRSWKPVIEPEQLDWDNPGKSFEKVDKKQSRCPNSKCNKLFLLTRPVRIVHTNIENNQTCTLCACPYCGNLWEEPGITIDKKKAETK